MDLEQVQLVVDGVDETDASSQQMHGPNAAVSQAAGAVGDLVMNVLAAVNIGVPLPEMFAVLAA